MQQQRKRGNPRRRSKSQRSRNRSSKVSRWVQHRVSTDAQPLGKAHLSLHEIDLITGNEDSVYDLFYEVYRGYTIYSTQDGRCCIHGRDGCLRIQGKYVCFPDIEQAKTLIKHFQADGRTAQESMSRYVPQQVYVVVCLTRMKGTQVPLLLQRRLVAVS